MVLVSAGGAVLMIYECVRAESGQMADDIKVRSQLDIK